MRNLRQLLLRFDLELPRTETPVPVVKEQAEAPREVANRPDGIKVPERLFADFGVPEQTFARTILTRPEAICDRLRDAGFSGMERRQALSREGWECSVLKTVGGGDAAEGTASSIFVFIRVDGREDRVESFRVKINIERPDERNETLALAVRAADVFLRFVRWDASGEITQRIAALDTFDVTRFGSRIRLMREMGRCRATTSSRPNCRSQNPNVHSMPSSIAIAGCRYRTTRSVCRRASVRACRPACRCRARPPARPALMGNPLYCPKNGTIKLDAD